MKLLLGLFILVVGFQVNAADGSSGCGPGWYVFKNNSLVSSSLRNTTNGFLFPVVTIGMTVGTSNCTKHSIVQTEKQSLEFVTQNVNELEWETAMANGEHISALASTIGCDIEAQSHFNKELQKNHGQIFKDKAPEKVLSQIYNVILTDRQLVNQCSLHNQG